MSQSSGFFNFLRLIGRGINVTRIVILNLVFFGLLALLFASMAQQEVARVPQASVLVVHPQGQLVEQYNMDPLQRALARLNSDGLHQVRLRDLLRAIDHAADDPRIDSLLLVPDRLQASGYAALREVGKALDHFKASGKKVYVWSAGMNQAQYYLAAHADRIALDPQGGVLLTGIASYRAYFKNLLDKLGVTIHLFRVGKFKSAAEPFVMDHASEASKQAAAYWMGSLWDTLLTEVAAERGIDEAALRADIQALPQQVLAAKGSLATMALDQHLVDVLMTRPEMRAWLRQQAHTDGVDGFRQIDMRRYLAALPPRVALTGAKVAVVVAEGGIVASEQTVGVVSGEVTSQTLRRLRNDDSVAALVLRIDSPGGAVYPSEQIRRQVALTRKAGKPVVVSMGDVAASGGYWIGMNANRILAQPNTITGSIGIFGVYPEIPEGLDKIGVNMDGVGTTPWAGALDFRRHLDPRIGTVIQSVIDKGYRDFVGRVAAARGMSFEAVDAVAQGRVWSGKQALERGLVDQLGGLGDAIEVAADLAELGDNYQVEYAQPPLGQLEQLLMRLGRGNSRALIQAVGLQLPQAWRQLAASSPALKLLSTLQPGRPQTLAYCFCRIGPGGL